MEVENKFSDQLNAEYPSGREKPITQEDFFELGRRILTIVNSIQKEIKALPPQALADLLGDPGEEFLGTFLKLDADDLKHLNESLPKTYYYIASLEIYRSLLAEKIGEVETRHYQAMQNQIAIALGSQLRKIGMIKTASTRKLKSLRKKST